MDTDPAASEDSTPPENATSEPVPAVPTRETTPVWVHTVPVSPAESTEPPHDSAEGEEALPALPMQKGDPDWSRTEPGEESIDGSPPPEAKKETPEWAQTVPTSPGEPLEDDAVASVTEPPKQVASNAARSTWPPASEAAPAPPEETDIWPPEPPTEHAMPAWPPPSELHGPATPARPIPSWSDSFDAVSPAEITHEPAAPAAPAPAPPAPAPMPAAQPPTVPPVESSQPETIPPEPEPEPVRPPSPAIAPPAPASVPAPSAKAPEPAPPPPAPAPVPPPAPAKPTPNSAPARPAWAPATPSEPIAVQQPGVEWPAPVQIPVWAPQISTFAEPTTSRPGTPTWFSPKEEVRHTSPQHAVTQPAPAPAATPMPAAPMPAAPIPAATPIPPTPQPAAPMPAPLPVAQAPVAPPAPAQPAQPKPTWEVVEQGSKSGPHARAQTGVTPEDRSYAEWFAWAKRGGAPASVCHAAAQGAFAALTSGKDVATAVQWATAAMSRPPEQVSYNRQTYCAWFALANIDLNLDQQRSHAFATGALSALDAGQDASAAHAAGLAAAGIR